MKQQSIVRSIATFAAVAALSAITSAVQAQGVAGGLVTNHIVQPGPQVIIGTPANPIPIDLDPNGSPWFKNIGDPNSNAPGASIVDMFETIINVGTEPWGDWHEFLFPAPAGLPPHTWTGVVGLTVNGNPIGFTATGLGTQTLDLFNFSQPVLPGDIFGIHKQVSVAGSAGVSGAFLRMQEYPTPWIPEPTSFALVTVSLALLAVSRRCR